MKLKKNNDMATVTLGGNAFCDSRENVQLFAGLMLCGNCQDNIQITNPGMFEANGQIEQKTQD